MPKQRTGAPRNPGNAASAGTAWGAYIPDIMRSYPDMPVRGRVVDGRAGKEFRPDPGTPAPRHRRDPALKNWLVDKSHDMAVQKMRETVAEAIRDLRAGIARLEKFIDEN